LPTPYPLQRKQSSTIQQQEAQGACGAHLVLKNPLAFVGFFLVQNSKNIWRWQLWNNSKYPIYANVKCIV